MRPDLPPGDVFRTERRMIAGARYGRAGCRWRRARVQAGPIAPLMMKRARHVVRVSVLRSRLIDSRLVLVTLKLFQRAIDGSGKPVPVVQRLEHPVDPADQIEHRVDIAWSRLR